MREVTNSPKLTELLKKYFESKFFKSTFQPIIVNKITL